MVSTPGRRRKFREVTLPAVLLIALLFILAFGPLSGCTAVESNLALVNPAKQVVPDYAKVEGGGLLTVFLNLQDPVGYDVVMEVSTIELKRGEYWEPLRTAPITLESAKIKGGQVVVARNAFAPGRYDGLRFVVKKVVSRSEAGQNILVDKEIRLLLNLDREGRLSKGDSHSIHVTWDVEETVRYPLNLAESLQAHGQAIPFFSNLLFAACPHLDTVYVVRTDRNWVISSIGIPGKPSYIEIDSEQKRLYVLAGDDHSISVIDLISFQEVERFALQLDFAPEFMVLDPDKRYAFVLDTRGRRIVKVDLSSGITVDRVSLNFYPGFILYLQQNQKLAITSPRANQVYFLNPGNLAAAGKMAVGIAPAGLLASDNLLLVAESGNNSVASYEMGSGRQQVSVRIRFAPQRLLQLDNQLYASGSGDGMLAVLFSGQLFVFSELFIGGTPLEMAASALNRQLYVGAGTRKGLTVIETVSNQVAGFVDLAASPLGLAVLD